MVPLSCCACCCRARVSRVRLQRRRRGPTVPRRRRVRRSRSISVQPRRIALALSRCFKRFLRGDRCSESPRRTVPFTRGWTRRRARSKLARTRGERTTAGSSKCCGPSNPERARSSRSRGETQTRGLRSSSTRRTGRPQKPCGSTPAIREHRAAEKGGPNTRPSSRSPRPAATASRLHGPTGRGSAHSGSGAERTRPPPSRETAWPVNQRGRKPRPQQ